MVSRQQPTGGRTSARIQKILEEKEAKRLRNPTEQQEDDEDVIITRRFKKKRTATMTSRRLMTAADLTPLDTTTSSLTPPTSSNIDISAAITTTGETLALTAARGSTGRARASSDGHAPLLSDKARVIDTIRIFNKHYLYFVQEEEKRCADEKSALEAKAKEGFSPEKKTKQPSKRLKLKAMTKEGSAHEKKTKQPSKRLKLKAMTKKGGAPKKSKRPDLKAMTKMFETKTTLNPNKRVGPVPGIDVGHQFFSRVEMVVVGLHGHWLNGIDYIGKTAGKKSKDSVKKYKGYRLPLAVSIVVSGQYEDDQDNYEDLIYTGQGGNDLLGKKHQIADQKMLRGNLALKNSIEQGTTVRVVRGHESRSSYTGKVYTYDGLYKVTKYWAEKGISGFTIFKYRLKRVQGQPPLTTNQVLYTNGRAPTSVSELVGLVCEDISRGQERIPIPATNVVDNATLPLTDYTYRKSMLVAESVRLPKAGPGCNCKGSCTDSKRCACAKLNGSDFPYVNKDGGRLIEPKGVVFECGPNCGCGPDCVNRTSQKGIRYQLEVFRTPSKGWGVRSWDFIPSGAPICEYIGVLMRTKETDKAHENFYLFDIDCFQTMKGLEGREKRLGDVSLPSHMQTDDDNSENDVEFCIDGGSTGNVARYINHSCQPNLFAQCVVSEHHDLKQARIVLFASDNIPALQEFCYDYCYKIDKIMGPDGKPKHVPCYCGAENCKKRML